ncbi:MAG: methyltransferase domain-containing protein [Chloroflexota bacterium]|nr:MAG: methyltransferase domain-containing protein [Chloroflexota bacterium]
MTGSKPQPLILDSLDELVYRATTTLAGIQLDLFTALKDGPLSAAQIAESIGVETAKLQPLLYALVIVGLLTVEEGSFANTAEADYYLVRGRPGYQGHRHKYWSDIWRAVLTVGESIRTGLPQAKHDYSAMPAYELEEFLHGLYPWTYDTGQWLAQNHDFSSCQVVLDAGGGSGALAIAMTTALPHLKAIVVEQAAVAPVTQRFVERLGASDRVQVKAVDLTRHPLSGPFDAAFLKAVIQTISLEEACLVLQNIYEALRPGGTVYVLDGPLDNSRLTPPDLVLFNAVFTAIYDHGQKYTIQEYRDVLTDAGFEGFALDADRIITARKPPS